MYLLDHLYLLNLQNKFDLDFLIVSHQLFSQNKVTELDYKRII